MAKFLSTNQINEELEKTIKSAEKYVILISPYLQISQKIKSLIEWKLSQKIPVILVYRPNENKLSDIEWAKKNDIEIFSIDSLHGKAYMNENSILITSMNLYQYSQSNNYEFGVLINRAEPEFKDAFLHIHEITNMAKKVNTKKGYCIMTGVEIEFDESKPFSYEAFKKWDKNPKSKQNYCHFSGEKSFGKTSFSNPIFKKQ